MPCGYLPLVVHFAVKLLTKLVRLHGNTLHLTLGLLFIQIAGMAHLDLVLILHRRPGLISLHLHQPQSINLPHHPITPHLNTSLQISISEYMLVVTLK